MVPYCIGHTDQHTWEGTTQEHEYSEVGETGGHLGGWLSLCSLPEFSWATRALTRHLFGGFLGVPSLGVSLLPLCCPEMDGSHGAGE